MDARAIGVNGLKRICHLILQDLEALPEDALTKRFGGKSRTVPDIVHGMAESTCSQADQPL